MNAEKALHSLVELFSNPLPGNLAQEDMIPVPRLGHKLSDSAVGSCIEAGVLALFYPRKNRLHLVFTRRTDRVSSHQAQISFPGGRREPDEEFDQTALRETNEELGVNPESVRILGRLTPLYVPPTNFCIYPVVGFAAERPDFRPSPNEVAEVIEVPVDHLLLLSIVDKRVIEVLISESFSLNLTSINNLNILHFDYFSFYNTRDIGCMHTN